MQACGSIHRVLWSQHCLHRDIILLGEIHEDTMEQLCLLHVVQIRSHIQYTKSPLQYTKTT